MRANDQRGPTLISGSWAGLLLILGFQVSLSLISGFWAGLLLHSSKVGWKVPVLWRGPGVQLAEVTFSMKPTQSSDTSAHEVDSSCTRLAWAPAAPVPSATHTLGTGTESWVGWAHLTLPRA